MKPTQDYTPRVYGFKINMASLYYKNNEDASLQRRVEGRERSTTTGRKKNRGGR